MEKKYPLGNQSNFDLIQKVLDPKVIDGALRSAIHAHGPITSGSRTIYVLEEDAQGFWQVSEVRTCSTSSAAKRIRGAIRTRVVEHLKQKELQKPDKWYSRFWRWLNTPFIG